jgi:hypothetical protein
MLIKNMVTFDGISIICQGPVVINFYPELPLLFSGSRLLLLSYTGSHETILEEGN